MSFWLPTPLFMLHSAQLIAYAIACAFPEDSEGLRLLNAEEVSDVLYKCKNVIDENPKLFKAVLKNPEEIAFISSLES